MGARKDDFEPLVLQEMGNQLVPLDIGSLNPRDCQVKAAFGHPLRLGVRGQDPFVDTHSRIRNCHCLRWKPTDVAQPKREFPSALARPIERTGREG